MLQGTFQLALLKQRQAEIGMCCRVVRVDLDGSALASHSVVELERGVIGAAKSGFNIGRARLNFTRLLKAFDGFVRAIHLWPMLARLSAEPGLISTAR